MFKNLGNTDHALELPDESIKAPATFNNILNPSLNYAGSKIRVEFNRKCLKQNKISSNHGKIVNIYIVYEINKEFNISGYQTMENCLFGLVKLTKIVDIDQYIYSGYDIGFDRKRFFSIS